jgi:tripartite-type tricarboxylate transporter receptor subunit TctC
VQIGAEQFTGLAFLGINKQFSREEADKIRADLIVAAKDPAVQELIRKLTAQHMDLDGKQMREFVRKYRADLNKILK